MRQAVTRSKEFVIEYDVLSTAVENWFITQNFLADLRINWGDR